jgi:FixJ family two-component response regulator
MGKTPHLVCIVDDDPSVRRALGRLVIAYGYEVKLFASGRQCLDEPLIDIAACLIIDVMMPDMSGFELHTLLTAAGHTIPTIFVSAHDISELKEREQLSSCVAFLNKPYDEELLYEALHNAISSK